MSLLKVIQEYLEGNTKAHHDVITKQNKGLTVTKMYIQRARQYMGYNLKREVRNRRIRPKTSYAAESPSP